MSQYNVDKERVLGLIGRSGYREGKKVAQSLLPDISSETGVAIDRVKLILAGANLLEEDSPGEIPGDPESQDLTLDEMEEDLDLDSFGSGSGLLDLSLQADDTTLGGNLDEIEDDLDLDSFGSGSGLLDLSLQADDTSLGGILDEIYTAEDEPSEDGERAETQSSMSTDSKSKSHTLILFLILLLIAALAAALVTWGRVSGALR